LWVYLLFVFQRWFEPVVSDPALDFSLYHHHALYSRHVLMQAETLVLLHFYQSFHLGILSGHTRPRLPFRFQLLLWVSVMGGIARGDFAPILPRRRRRD